MRGILIKLEIDGERFFLSFSLHCLRYCFSRSRLKGSFITAKMIPVEDILKSESQELIVRFFKDRRVDDVRVCGYSHPLLFAAREGLYQLAFVLVNNGADVDVCDMAGSTPLCHAVFRKNTALAELLLRHGADVDHSNWKGKSPLYLAILNNDPEMVELLLRYNANMNQIVNWWLGKCQVNDVDGPLIFFALDSRRSKAARAMLQSPKLDVTVRDSLDRTLLMRAMGSAIPVDVFELILRNPKTDVEALDMDHEFPLQTAVYRNQVDRVRLLLDRGANPFRSLGGISVFEFTCQQSSLSMVYEMVRSRPQQWVLHEKYTVESSKVRTTCFHPIAVVSVALVGAGLTLVQRFRE